jgi:hypothetical protein
MFVTKGKMYATDVRMHVIAVKTAATGAEGGNNQSKRTALTE